MRISWKKTFIVTSDVLIAIYLLLAFTAFNKPDEAARLCTKVNINIQDEATNGFIDARERTALSIGETNEICQSSQDGRGVESQSFR